jgi:hypothetical protein
LNILLEPKRLTKFVKYLNLLTYAETLECSHHDSHQTLSKVVTMLDTPLFESVINDRICWRFEKNGKYTVKSAIVSRMQLIWIMLELQATETCCGHPNYHRKSRISCGARICRNCLPTRIRLRTQYARHRLSLFLLTNNKVIIKQVPHLLKFLKMKIICIILINRFT